MYQHYWFTTKLPGKDRDNLAAVRPPQPRPWPPFHQPCGPPPAPTQPAIPSADPTAASGRDRSPAGGPPVAPPATQGARLARSPSPGAGERTVRKGAPPPTTVDALNGALPYFMEFGEVAGDNRQTRLPVTVLHGKRDSMVR